VGHRQRWRENERERERERERVRGGEWVKKVYGMGHKLDQQSNISHFFTLEVLSIVVYCWFVGQMNSKGA
jgi:hypothetical protein